MAQITTFTVTVAGTAPTPRTAATGDTAQVGSGYVLEVTNGGASPVTVTLAYPGNLVTGDAIPDKAYTVAAGASARIPLLGVYADPVDGLAHITYSATASVNVAVVKV